MTPDLLAPLMFTTLVVILLAGFPVAFSLAAVAAAFGVLGVALGQFNHAFLLNMPLRVQGIFNSDNFLAVPLFVLMGQIAFHSGISQRLFDTAYRFIGHLPGGLAIATVGACAAFSAICGSTNATAATMGAATLPEMKRYNYKPKKL